MSFLPVACVAAWHYRPVWLEVLPAVAVDHYVLDAQADGTFRAALRMSADASGYIWTVSMKGLKDGEPLLTADGKEQLTFSLGNSSAEQTFEGASSLFVILQQHIPIFRRIHSQPFLYVAAKVRDR